MWTIRECCAALKAVKLHAKHQWSHSLGAMLAQLPHNESRLMQLTQQEPDGQV